MGAVPAASHAEVSDDATTAASIRHVANRKAVSMRWKENAQHPRPCSSRHIAGMRSAGGHANVCSSEKSPSATLWSYSTCTRLGRCNRARTQPISRNDRRSATLIVSTHGWHGDEALSTRKQLAYLRYIPSAVNAFLLVHGFGAREFAQIPQQRLHVRVDGLVAGFVAAQAPLQVYCNPFHTTMLALRCNSVDIGLQARPSETLSESLCVIERGRLASSEQQYCRGLDIVHNTIPVWV